MKQLFAVIMAAAACLPSAAQSEMRSEADAFLKAVPQSVQHAQRDAVLSAVRGDMRPLLDIRASRRPTFTVSPGVDTLTIDGRHILFRPKEGRTPLPLLVYLHGGGWTFGSPASAARFCDSIAATGVAAVLAVDYPLSPETSEDAQATWLTWLAAKAHGTALEQGLDRNRIFIGGDSAGGYMALLGAMVMPEAYAGVIPIYPVITSAPSDDVSWREYGAGYANNADIMAAFYKAWQKGNVTPADRIPRLDTAPDSVLAAMPPVCMIAAGRDVLRDSGVAFAARMAKAGVDVTRVEFPDAVHLFITVPGQPSAFGRAVSETVKFIGK